jgi:hypothetical protein
MTMTLGKHPRTIARYNFSQITLAGTTPLSSGSGHSYLWPPTSPSVSLSFIIARTATVAVIYKAIRSPLLKHRK